MKNAELSGEPSTVCFLNLVARSAHALCDAGLWAASQPVMAASQDARAACVTCRACDACYVGVAERSFWALNSVVPWPYLARLFVFHQCVRSILLIWHVIILAGPLSRQIHALPDEFAQHVLGIDDEVPR